MPSAAEIAFQVESVKPLGILAAEVDFEILVIDTVV